jgi:small GTP-binding protein
MEPIKQDIRKKVIVLGEGGVGKTTLLYRYVNEVFKDSTKMTIGSDFFMKKIITPQARITLLLWDFAGQERFRFILKEFTRGAEGILLVFDLVCINTLQKLYDWVEVLKDGNVWQKSNVKFILVGTKKDLTEDGNNPHTVSPETIAQFRENFGISEYFETSSVDGVGVEELFQRVAHLMIEKKA